MAILLVIDYNVRCEKLTALILRVHQLVSCDILFIVFIEQLFALNYLDPISK